MVGQLGAGGVGNPPVVAIGAGAGVLTYERSGMVER
ncbi:hypothetical protein NONO_c54940 [Nocardia nova SH22a]|uniref:Uncharacterized protein n=1 Tax=Nocardia nova SH22a TaxID=1415166 RepID=W5TMA5_9NOCA|nr:hypothetical protein NONO_c54940 [Nocardia nova SH22a]